MLIYDIILCCAVMGCAALRCAVQFCAVLCSAALRYTRWYITHGERHSALHFSNPFVFIVGPVGPEGDHHGLGPVGLPNLVRSLCSLHRLGSLLIRRHAAPTLSANPLYNSSWAEASLSQSQYGQRSVRDFQAKFLEVGTLGNSLHIRELHPTEMRLSSELSPRILHPSRGSCCTWVWVHIIL